MMHRLTEVTKMLIRTNMGGDVTIQSAQNVADGLLIVYDVVKNYQTETRVTFFGDDSYSKFDHVMKVIHK